MATLDWSQCSAVESVADRRERRLGVRDTHMPVATVFENTEAVMTAFPASRTLAITG